jgi:predicted aspartyl protease
MGLTHEELLVKPDRSSRRKAMVESLVDSGVVHSLVPAGTLKKMGIRPYREVGFILADGTKIKREVGDAYLELNGEGGAAPILFGEKGDEPLLGATTLEAIGLVLGPFKRRLLLMRMMLA